MSDIKKYIPGILALFSFIFLWRYLQQSQEFAFFEREHEQMFIYSWSVFCERYFSVGGLALLVSQFLIQFFSIPYLGSAVTAALCTGSAYFIWMVVRKFNAPWWAFPLCLLPAIFMTLDISDIFYDYSGFVAFFFASLFLWLYHAAAGGAKPLARLLIGFAMAAGLYLLAGPAASVFVIGIFFIDILGSAGGPIVHLATIAAYVLFVALLFRLGLIDSMSRGLTDGFYYDVLLKIPYSFELCPVVLPATLLLAWLCGLVKSESWYLGIGLLCASIAVVAGARSFLSRYEFKKSYIVLRMEHDVAVSDWNDILSCKEATSGSNFMLMNYVNLALSHKGVLLDRLFKYHQSSLRSLLCSDEESEFNNQMVMLYANIYYWVRYVGAAQNKAFDAYTSCEYGNPEMLKMLVKTNLVYGNPKVAEKYISLLEKTWGYRAWAKDYRRFLYDDSAVQADPELGSLLRALPDSDVFTVRKSIFVQLPDLLALDPANKAAGDYAIASILLTRSYDTLSDLLEKLPLDKMFDVLPDVVQQALLVIHEGDFEYCRNAGVTDSVIEEYKNFKDIFLRNSRNGLNPKRELKSKYGTTFWYYYMYGEK
jgi:hypothetical protein